MPAAASPSSGTGPFDGCPAYVRGWCCKARDRSLKRGYVDVGYLLAAKLRRFRPPGLDPQAWRRHLGRLSAAIRSSDEQAALWWFRDTYPALMAMIPAGNHAQFIAGVSDRRRPQS